jgi:hypothetical protein
MPASGVFVAGCCIESWKLWEFVSGHINGFLEIVVKDSVGL